MKKLLEESQWYGWYLNQLLPKYVWYKSVNHYIARNSKFEKDIIFPRVDGLHWCTAHRWSHLCTSPWWNNSRGERNVTCNIKGLAYWTTEHHGEETIGRTQWMWLIIYLMTLYDCIHHIVSNGRSWISKSYHLYGEADENHKNLTRISQLQGRVLGSPGYKAGV